MKSIILLITITLFTFVGQGQNISSDKASVRYGQPQELKFKRSRSLSIIGKIGQKTFSTRYLKGKMLLESYDENFNRITGTPLVLMNGSDKLSLKGISIIDNKLILFATYIDKEKEEQQFFAREINQSTLQTGESVLLGTMPYSKKGLFGRTGFFTTVISPDQRSFAMYANPAMDKEVENPKEKFEVVVFNSNLKKTWEDLIEIPYEDSYFRIENIKIDNDGAFYFSGLEYAEKRERKLSRKEGTPSYKYHILKFSQKTALDYEVKLNDFFITDLQFEVVENGNIISSGFYSKDRKSALTGCFYLKLDGTSKDVIKSSTQEFSFDLITENMTEKQEKKAKKKKEKGKEPQLNFYSLDDLIIQKDGSIVLLAEQYYMRVTTTTDSKGNTHTTYHYYYNDVIVVKITPEGEIDWSRKVDKSQYSTNDGGFYSGYDYTIKNDHIYLIFNDNPKNFIETGTNRTYTWKPSLKVSALTIADVKPTGEYTKEVIEMVERKKQGIIKPVSSRFNFLGEHLIIRFSRKTFQIGEVKIK